MKKDQYDVIVTDASQRVSLELTRALGGMGLRILNVERELNAGKAIASSSRYSAGFEKVPDYTSEKFLELSRKVSAIFPVSTNTNIALYQKAVPMFPEKFLLPDAGTFIRANSKPAAVEIACGLGIPCPRSAILKSGDLPHDSFGKVGYPIVLKLADDENLSLEPQDRYGIADSEKDAEKHWNRLKVHGKDILVQEYLSGEGCGWSAIYDRKGSCLASITHLRLREYPISGGPSSYCMAIEDETVAGYGRKILDGLKWTGPAMVEFKKDSKGQPRFLEINPRYWGSLPLARAAGMNMPYMQYLAIAGNHEIPTYSYKRGAKIKFRGMDLMAALQEFGKAKSKTGYAVKFICEFMDPRIPDGIFSLKDPLPGLVYAWKNLFGR